MSKSLVAWITGTEYNPSVKYEVSALFPKD